MPIFRRFALMFCRLISQAHTHERNPGTKSATKVKKVLAGGKKE
jgi:hypothetical protein